MKVRNRARIDAVLIAVFLIVSCNQGVFSGHSDSINDGRASEDHQAALDEDESIQEPQIVTGAFLTCTPVDVGIENPDNQIFGCHLVDAEGHGLDGKITEIALTFADGTTISVDFEPADDPALGQVTFSIAQTRAVQITRFDGRAIIAGTEQSVTENPQQTTPAVNPETIIPHEEAAAPIQDPPEKSQPVAKPVQQTSEQPSLQADITCPAEFIPVPAEPAVGVSNAFCVARFEMRNDGGDNPVSTHVDKPWVNISHSAAKTACGRLGVGYALISNSEWMAIARSIEREASNWSTAQVGMGSLNRGHSDRDPAEPLVASMNLEDACLGTNQICDNGIWNEQKRTHKLVNGQVLWDFAGNVHEIIDWVQTTGKASPDDEWIELTESVPTSSMPKAAFFPENETLSKSNGIGAYYPGEEDTGGTTQRGGSYGDFDNTGIYALALDLEAQRPHSVTGFRCVFHP